MYSSKDSIYPDDKILLCLHVRWNDIHHFAPPRPQKRQGDETDDDLLDKLTQCV